MSEQIYICSPFRTAIGSFGGALSSISAPRLGAHLIAETLKKEFLSPEAIDEVILGCVVSAGAGQGPARQSAVFSGLPVNVQALTINKVCSSGLKAVQLAANSIRLGQANAMIAGGMESMSQAPYLLPKMRNGARLGHSDVLDSLLVDALWDVFKDFHMGEAAEMCADAYSLSRESQDDFAIESYKRANDAIAAGHFKNEILPIEVTQGKSSAVVDTDEEPGRGKPDKIPLLKPVFRKEGTVTAANASSINDGAATVIVCSEKFAKDNGLEPYARILSQGSHAQEPERFTTAPVGAVSKALADASLKVDEIDLFEINEAFSAVALACSSELKIAKEKLNISGGAVALGHPVGASGARILVTLLHNLKRTGLKRGAVGICNGGGEATAMVVERV